ncbi:MAG: FHA domain-containing protein [Actinomycetota bacterium]|nr:FHA domain-containing protein [Actinomycetota bacterium]
MTAFDLRPASPADIAERGDAERTDLPFMVYRDPSGRQQIFLLATSVGSVTIGRRADSDLPLVWDPNVSRVHAQLEPIGGEWAIVDDGLSRQGTMVNGRKLSGRLRLHDRDVITIGLTPLLYRCPPDPAGSTAAGRQDRPPPQLTDTQHQVLIALCRPCLKPDVLVPPASNRQIANEVFLSVDAVKAHLRALFVKFNIGQLPHNEKRVSLVGEAIRCGSVTRRAF